MRGRTPSISRSSWQAAWPWKGRATGGCWDGTAGTEETTEFDAAADLGDGVLLVVEAKAYTDYALSRDHVLIFSGKLRDHVDLADWRWGPPVALLASAGRLDTPVIKWC